MTSATFIMPQTNYLKAKLWKYFEIIRVSYYHNTTYTGDLLSLGLLAAIRLWALKELYQVTYHAQGATQIGGLSVALVVWSLVVTNSFQLGIGSRTVLKPLAEEIQSGNIAYALTKPYSFLWYLYFSNIGRLVARLLPALILASITAVILVGPIHLTWPALGGGLLLSVLGLSQNLITLFVLSILAFWLEEVNAFRWIYDKFQFALGGMIIPLSLFPDSLRKIAEFLPFASAYYAPARIFVSFDAHLFYKYLLVSLSWTILFTVILIIIFRNGVKNISINGG
jgi:ABC-2 type transport system permease protein